MCKPFTVMNSSQLTVSSYHLRYMNAAINYNILCKHTIIPLMFGIPYGQQTLKALAVHKVQTEHSVFALSIKPIDLCAFFPVIFKNNQIRFFLKTYLHKQSTIDIIY